MVNVYETLSWNVRQVLTCGLAVNPEETGEGYFVVGNVFNVLNVILAFTKTD